jgi:hypothetical protein
MKITDPVLCDGWFTNRSLLTDRDGNIYSVKILKDNKIWMSVNLKLNIPNSIVMLMQQLIVKNMVVCIHGRSTKGCALLGERLATSCRL